MDPSFEDNWEVLESFDPEIKKSLQNPLDYFLETYSDNAGTHEFASMMEFYNLPEEWASGSTNRQPYHIL